MIVEMTDIRKACFNPAEAEEGFSSGTLHFLTRSFCTVSIQPKPKKGLVATGANVRDNRGHSFNTAEAEEGFSSKMLHNAGMPQETVSIQPKPKKGLVETI